MSANFEPYPIHLGSYPAYNQMRTEDLILAAEQKGAKVIALKVYDLHGNILAKGRTSLTALKMTDMKEAVRGMDLLRVFCKTFPNLVKIPKQPDGTEPLNENVKKQVVALINKAVNAISEEIIRDEVEPPNGTICPVTTDLMQKPSSPNQCGHSFDETTLLGLLKRAGEKGEKAHCPECRTEFDGFTPNIGVRRTIEEFLSIQKKKIIPQINCDEENQEIAAIHLKQAKDHVKSGNFNKAETSYKKALENTKDHSIYNEIPEMYIKMNAPKKAAISFFFSMKYDMELANTPLKLLDLLLKIQELKVTSPYLEQLLVIIYPLTGENEKASNCLAEIGRKWLKLENPDISAIKECFKTSLMLHPQNFLVYNELADIEQDNDKKRYTLLSKVCHLMKKKKFKEGVEIFNQLPSDNLKSIEKRIYGELIHIGNMIIALAKYWGQPDSYQPFPFCYKEDMKMFKLRISEGRDTYGRHSPVQCDETVVDLYVLRNRISKGISWVTRLADARIRQEDFKNAEQILLYAKEKFGEKSVFTKRLYDIYKNHLVDGIKRAQICHTLGQQYLNQNQYTGAENYFKEAYALNPSFLIGIQYAETLTIQKKTAESVKLYFELLGAVIIDADSTTMNSWLSSLQTVDPTLSKLTTDQKIQVHLLKQNQTLSEKLNETKDKLDKAESKLSNLSREQSRTDDEIRFFQAQPMPKNREEALEILKDHPKLMQYYPDKWRDNLRFVLDALVVNPSVFQYVSRRLRGVWKVAYAAVQKMGSNLEYASNVLQNDKEIVLKAIENYPSSLEYANYDLQDDEDIVLRAVNLRGNSLRFASNRLKNDKRIVLAAIKVTVGRKHIHSSAYQFASEEVKSDEEIALLAIQSHFPHYNRVSESLRSNQHFTIKALKLIPTAYNCNGVPKKLFSKKDFVIKACKLNANILKFCNNEFKENIEIVRTAIESFGSALRHAASKFRDDRDIVFTAVTKQGNSLEYASERLKDDEKIVHAAINETGNALKFASPRLRNDDKTVMSAVKKNGRAIEHASIQIKDNFDFIACALQSSDDPVLKYASDKLKDNKQLLLKAVEKDGRNLEYASTKAKDDKEIAHKAIKQNGLAYRYLSENLKCDHELALDALKSNAFSFGFVPEKLFSDKSFMLAALKVTYRCLEIAPPLLTNDSKFMEEAISHDPFSLKYASETLKSDWKLVEQAVCKNGQTLEYASDKLKDDKDLVVQAVRNDGSSLQYASDKLKDDKTIVLEAINNQPSSLKHASIRFRNDQDLILKYTKEHPSILEGASVELKNSMKFMTQAFILNAEALKYAADQLRDDKPFVISLIKKNGYGVGKASDRLNNDIDVVLAAVPFYGSVLKYVPEKFKSNKYVVRAAVKSHPDALQHASEEIRADKEFIISLLKLGVSLDHVSEKIKKDPEVINAANLK